ncbi:hypothetical protein BC6307_02500 [Sutcliffiella cohnii]|uniref:Alkaline phosphatase family protein n=1 Tax=Sutcliffiella cohnii TaxID=33932 RepID=A0A223KL59_9BACI|nr:alkaline phosphatase family protein [Sutcliffiella cohnii]AST90230.1 hypothetical protein BC6307_02500 [Sutcliffiella cohnii]
MRKCYILLLCLSLLGCQQAESTQHANNSSKNVIMIMVDSMTGELVHASLKEEADKFPALQFLVENGNVYNDLVAPFPSMSVSIESTLITGEMPNKHSVPGLTWYDVKNDRLIDYGTSIETYRKLGFKQSLEDSLYNLNNVHLSKETTTIFEELHDRGIKSGAINLLLYRGKTEHEIEPPAIIQWTTGLSEKIKTNGPDILSFGTFYRPKELQTELLPDALLLKAGLSDYYATEAITKLIKNKEQPPFLLAFFPDMDKRTHRNGPPYVHGLKTVDDHLQRILDAYGSWEEALEQNVFILFGDHGQASLVENEERAKLNLHELYNQYNIAPFGEKPSSGDIVIANNHRSAYIYPINKQIQKEELVDVGLQDPRMAIVASEENGWIEAWSPDYHQPLKFKKGGEWKDSYGQQWTIEGEVDVLKLEMSDEDKLINYTEYPDALNQLYSALHSLPNSIIVTAKPGFVVFSETTPVHNGGGEHGGLHRDETLAVLIVSGTDKEFENPRIVDLKDYILNLFDE